MLALNSNCEVRQQSVVIDGKEKKWTERVLVVNSPAYAKQKEKGLEKRLQNAEKKIYAHSNGFCGKVTD